MPHSGRTTDLSFKSGAMTLRLRYTTATKTTDVFKFYLCISPDF